MPHRIAVVVLAAGAGTRMRSKTPKVLHTLAGRTMLGHALHAAAGLDPEHLVTVVGHDRESVSAAVSTLSADLGREIAVAIQDEQNGTGHAVQCALTALPESYDGTVVVTAADVPLLDTATLQNLVDGHTARPANTAMTVLSFTADDPTGYGRIVRDDTGAVVEIVEQADADADQRAITEVNSGVYAFDTVALREALTHLGTDNEQHELYLTDVLRIARERGRAVYSSLLADPSLVQGVNDRVQLARARRLFNERIVEAHERAGVTVVDPATTWIDVQVRIERDVVIEPGTQLRGRTSVGEDALIGPDTTLTDVTVGARASVVRTHGSESTVGDDATVGPFAFLRPGAALGEAGKIGTFVEVKNTTIGAHTKVPHLTYVGDATIGEHSNIGASSVFVNYDGVNKHHTVVGSHVRTGSDTTFIAPVSVGDGAYTGAGTVLRHDVPPGALAISSGEQRIIDGWVERKRPGTQAAQAADRARRASTPEQGSTHQQDRTKDGEQ